MFRLSIICSALAFCASQKAIHFIPCGGEIEEVRVIPCIDEPCKFQRGGNVIVEVDFTANSGVENPRIAVTAKLGSLELPLPGLKLNACEDYNLDCPLRKDKQYTFKHILSVLPIFPKINTTTIYKLTGGEQGILFCFETPVQITDEE